MHPLAKSAFSTVGSSGLYDRARPSYPPEALAEVAQILPASALIVELGSGTGIFTRCLLTPESPTRPKVGSLIAVEPAEGMRIGFANAMTALLDDTSEVNKVKLNCVDGTFDRIPIDDGQADLLVAAQAYHWIGSNFDFQEKCIAEAARVVKPGGYFALIWNLEDRDQARWVASLRDAYEKFEAGTPQYRNNWWRPIFDTPSFNKHFVLLPESGGVATSQTARPTLNVTRELPTTLEGVKDRVLSKSYISEIPQADKDDLCRAIDSIWEKGEDLKWVDKTVGEALYPYSTQLYIIKRV